MNNLKKNAGISLVALVITIIVLIILTAAVVITGINTPENNEYAVKMHNKAVLQDAVTLYVMTETLNDIDGFVVDSTGATKARKVADVVTDLYKDGTWTDDAVTKLGISITLDELRSVFQVDDKAVVTFKPGQQPTLENGEKGTDGTDDTTPGGNDDTTQGGDDDSTQGGNDNTTSRDRTINLIKDDMTANSVWKFDANQGNGTYFATTTDWYSYPELISVSSGEVVVVHNLAYTVDEKQLVWMYSLNSSTGKYEDKTRICFGDANLTYNSTNNTHSFTVPDGVTHIGISAKWDSTYQYTGNTYVEISAN